jgi:hypothetical protein
VLVQAVATDADRIIMALNDGVAAGMEITFKLPTGEHVRMFMPDRWPDPNAPLTPTPWAIDGIEQIGIATDTPILDS